jgi:hypothetical protein
LNLSANKENLKMLTNGIDLDNLIKINSDNFANVKNNKNKTFINNINQKLNTSHSEENLNRIDSTHNNEINENSNYSSRASSPCILSYFFKIYCK